MEFTSDQSKRVWHIVCFGILYLGSFFLVENRVTKINIIHTTIDDYIPFCEYFIIPYVLWYAFVGVTVLYFVLINKNDKEYYPLVISLAIGMIVFLIVSYMYPNGQNLRPYLDGSNIFERIVQLLYRIDTSTNILPSLHVFNAVVCCVAWCRHDRCKKHKFVLWSMIVLTVLICLSTMFLKQHSFVDVVTALILNGCCYHMFYHRNLVTFVKHCKEKWAWKKSGIFR